MTDLNWLLLLGATVISKSTWEQIPADVRPALLAATREAGSRLRADVRASGGRDVEAMKKRRASSSCPEMDARARDLWRKAAESCSIRTSAARWCRQTPSTRRGVSATSIAEARRRAALPMTAAAEAAGRSASCGPRPDAGAGEKAPTW